MTGVLPFLYFHKHTIITIKDATLMSQSTTTITHKHGRRDAIKEERINIEIDEQIEYEQRRDAYPEPEGDPSY